MSWAFITALKKNPQQSYVQLLNSIREELESKYTQKPQLSCSHPLSKRPGLFGAPESHALANITLPRYGSPVRHVGKRKRELKAIGTACNLAYSRRAGTRKDGLQSMRLILCLRGMQLLKFLPGGLDRGWLALTM